MRDGRLQTAGTSITVSHAAVPDGADWRALDIAMVAAQRVGR